MPTARVFVDGIGSGAGAPDSMAVMARASARGSVMVGGSARPSVYERHGFDQTRQVDITAESFVRTAWMQSSHEPDGCYVAGNGRATGSGKLDSVVCEAIAGRSCSNSPCVRPT